MISPEDVASTVPHLHGCMLHFGVLYSAVAHKCMWGVTLDGCVGERWRKGQGFMRIVNVCMVRRHSYRRQATAPRALVSGVLAIQGIGQKSQGGTDHRTPSASPVHSKAIYVLRIKF